MQLLTFQIFVDLEEILHSQVPLIALKEHGIEPSEKGPTEDAIAILGRDRLGRESGVLPFQLRLQPQNNESQTEDDSQDGGNNDVFTGKPVCPESREIQENGENEEDLDYSCRPDRTAMLQVTEDKEDQDGR
jgi:hypothetical protein